MYKKQDRETNFLFPEMFPFGGKLDSNNRWLKMSELIPWDELENAYAKKLSPIGRPACDARLVLGLLILKHIRNLSDEEINDELYENVYMQSFCGLDHFLTKEALDSSTLTNVRKRLGVDFIREMEELTYKMLVEKKVIKARGMLCDATVIPEKISYPNDIGLLEKCRRKVVGFIKKTQEFVGEKYRTYNRNAKKAALDFSKKKKKTKDMIVKTKKKMLNYLSRNIKQAEDIIEKTLKKGKEIVFDEFETLKKIYCQQKEMYMAKSCQIAERIVSISKSYVRPIKRGKDGKNVEFGPKGAFGYIDGFLFMDKFSHDNFSEAKKDVLEKQIENFAKLFGKKPSYVVGDNLYGTQENRKFLSEIGVRAAFKPLGRKSLIKSLPEKRWLKEKHKERNKIEGAFGHAKEHLGLKPIRYKSSEGAEIWVRLGILGMNLKTALSKA